MEDEEVMELLNQLDKDSSKYVLCAIEVISEKHITDQNELTNLALQRLYKKIENGLFIENLEKLEAKVKKTA